MQPLLVPFMILALTALSMGTARASDVDQKAETFCRLAHGIIEQTVTGSLQVAAVERDVAAMEELATYFARQYQVKYPAGAKVMDFILAQQPALTGLTLEAIDAQFESEAINKSHGKDLGLDITEEEHEHYSNPIDLFVHPATAQICARMWAQDRQPERLKRIQSELQEVIEHCHLVVDRLKK